MKITADLLYAAGESCSDMRYATGFVAHDPHHWFRLGDRSVMIVSPLEYNRALHNRKSGVELHCTTEYEAQTSVAMAVEIARKYRIDCFRVPAYFPLFLADQLRAAGVEVIPEEGNFFPEREFKSAGEVQMVIEGLRLAENAVRKAFTILSDASVDSRNRLIWQGEALTSERLRREIDLVILDGGGVASGTIAAAGSQSAEPHNVGSGIIYANTPIVMDVFPRIAATGYCGDLTRTVVKGKAPEIVQKAYLAVREARDRSREKMVMGADPVEIHTFAQKVLEQHGFHTGRNDRGDFGFFHGLGHGVGMDIHENPRVGIRNHIPLQGGEIITCEPGLYYPEWGGIRLEDMVHVTPAGPVNLTELDDFLTLE
ncbi:MAG: aminopeptidase P family protein [Lentisphaeria bacterium]|nr:aminopeptidase P family protein [Lentisphaeria bacterium]